MCMQSTLHNSDRDALSFLGAIRRLQPYGACDITCFVNLAMLLIKLQNRGGKRRNTCLAVSFNKFTFSK